jgi:hypothetical protein
MGYLELAAFLSTARQSGALYPSKEVGLSQNAKKY